MRILFLSLVFSLVCTALRAQNRDYCATYQVLEKQLNENPKLREAWNLRQEALKKLDLASFANQYQGKTATVIYTIPVVFHILHQGGPENINDAQVIDAINVLNRDFRKQNADTAQIENAFKPLASDVKFEFRLATKDTNGNCTSGIIHHFDADTYWDGAPARFKYTWNSSRYLNFYVVKQFLGGLTWAAAYSSFPGTNPPERDVIVTLNNYVGTIGTSSPYNSRTLTHETGHYFDLHHVWGDTQCGTTCGDDGVGDTPLTKGWNSCPGTPTGICTPSITENYQNYMEYSYCINMFTSGQVVRMTNAITSTVSGRNNLWSNANLIATGIVNPANNCAPVADLYAMPGIYITCSGTAITLQDFSFNGAATSRTWAATGAATIASQGASVTSIIFPGPGTQTVSLTVSNNFGTSTASKTVNVVNATAEVPGSYYESFEGNGLPNGFSIINYDQDVTWAQTSSGAASGANSYYISGFGDPPASKPDILETPSYDFAADPNAVFTFKYAYAKSTSTCTDIFKVMGSKDCGATWQDIYWPTTAALALNSGGVSNVPFIPSPSQFVTYTLSDHPNFVNFAGQANVKFRFYFKEDSMVGYGNNFYLDDINFSSTVIGLKEHGKEYSMIVSPNPSSASVKVQFSLSDASEVKCFIYDVCGRMLEEKTRTVMAPGKNYFFVNEDAKLQSGVYFIHLEINGQKLIRKVVIE